MRACTKCKKYLPDARFSKRKALKSGYRSQCKGCDSICNNNQAKKRTPEDERIRRLKYKYGMSLQDYEDILKKQGNRCAICKSTSNSDPNRKNNFDVDHCHVTGVVRGLLCSNCNTGIGLLKDSVDNLNSAIKYLEHSFAEGH